MKKSILLFCILVFGKILLAKAQDPCPPGSLTIKWTLSNDFTSPVGVDPKNPFNARFISHKPLMIPRMNTGLNWLKRQEKYLDGAFWVSSRREFSPGESHPEALENNPWHQSTGRLGFYLLSNSSRYAVCINGRPHELNGPAWINIVFNYFQHTGKAILTSKGPYLLNGKAIYEIPELHSTNGRIDYYEYPGDVPAYVVNYGNWWFKHTFILRNSDKPLFIPVTQKEFLQDYLKEMEKLYLEIRNLTLSYTPIASPEEILAERDARIAEIKKNAEEKGWSQQSLEHSLNMAEEFFKNKLEEEKNKVANLTAGMDEQYTESKRLIRDYLANQPEPVLKKAIRTFETIFTYEVAGVKQLLDVLNEPIPERSWGKNTQIVYINPEYFDPKLSDDIPQFIAVEFVNLENLHQHLNHLAYYLRENWDFGEFMELLK